MNIRALLTVAAALCCATPAPAAAYTPPTPEAGSLRLVDLTDEFEAFWERTGDIAPEARLAAFQTHFEDLIPGFYDPARFGPDRRERYENNVVRALDAYPDQREGVREVSARFAELFEPARASFEAEFGAFPRQETIYLLHSLGEMDGGTRSLPRGNLLLFGADMIARYHLDHRIQPFFHHELFHLRHVDRFTECEQEVWCSLWVEGLATYVAARLNPDATDAELLLEIPEPIRPAVDSHRDEAVCAVRARLDSTASEDARTLFSFDRMNERLPPRFGYYVGYLAASTIGEGRSLQELATLNPAEVRPLLEAALDGLAACPA